MRRQEFSMEEEQELTAFLQEQTFGFLGTVTPDGEPRVTPLNFVYDQGIFYFHGSLAGEKMKNIRSHDRVSFTVAEEFSLIPSYYSDPEMACPATSYFKSVAAVGTARPVQDAAEKAHALGLFMAKLQPEGGYAPIDASDSRYAPRLKSVSVVAIVPERISAKFKFGQNLKTEAREQIASQLEERARGKDMETARLMRQFCPFHAKE
ncbi:pyridoxamine 5'-phosphate oxidase family protein [Paenibacillus sp. JX-17]|uniref:Pyridoxamine 5'-phosphate oxidase family protein n=1 Tax=Paenibacillus lacisoli TaxID=3064525 RepID=A0ABT9CDS3_9BACL|nr:pyridoxamine 5'-phosphate oxidase family protein [Paenibacillus sp. JX-17]MDO7907015.1 pyridoxamine 5'-phosphate oxidase family protein [Paenibacillus sp. JX-17]